MTAQPESAAQAAVLTITTAVAQPVPAVAMTIEQRLAALESREVGAVAASLESKLLAFVKAVFPWLKRSALALLIGGVIGGLVGGTVVDVSTRAYTAVKSAVVAPAVVAPVVAK